MTAPKVFVSYSYDSAAHKDWVRTLASDLRARGIDTILDQWDLAPGEDIVAFMETSVTQSDRVLLICTEAYVEKADRGDGGVGYERLIVSSELVARIDTKKFVPIVRQEAAPPRTPRYIGTRYYVNFSSDSEYEQRLDELAREIHGQRSASKPPLGPNPYEAVAPPRDAIARLAGPSGLTASGREILADEWFEQRAATGAAGLKKAARIGAMEARFGLHDPLRKSQVELLNAVRKSEIHTFGWPFAVTLENREEFRPRPVSDGITAEVSITEKGLSGESSYDLWYARSNGDFYALQSLFEDERVEKGLFFNTRIVRITEALLFAANYYENLGAAPESRVSVRIAHQGLAGRTLASSNPNRHVWPRTTTADTSETQIVEAVGSIRERLVDHVIQVAAPMFLLFDFAEFEHGVYENIVRSFEQGRVT